MGRCQMFHQPSAIASNSLDQRRGSQIYAIIPIPRRWNESQVPYQRKSLLFPVGFLRFPY